MSDFEALWREMETNPGEHSYGLLRRRLTLEKDDGLFVGLDPASRQRIFLVDLPQEMEFSMRSLPRWTEVQVERVVLEKRPQRIRVKITLVNPRFADVFTAFASDLYRALQPLSGPTVPDVLIARLEKWNRFFREHGPEGLSEEEQRGLCGELLFLRRHVLPRLAGIKGIRVWMGPGGAAHDFRLPGGCVEAKTLGLRPPRIIHIANEGQLDDEECSPLYLYWARLEPADTGESLPGLVEDIRHVIAFDRFATDAFEQKLLMAGYLDTHAPLYGVRYRVGEEVLCQVKEGFPRIVRPPEGIGFVRYDLAPEVCRSFQVDLARVLGTLVDSGEGA